MAEPSSGTRIRVNMPRTPSYAVRCAWLIWIACRERGVVARPSGLPCERAEDQDRVWCGCHELLCDAAEGPPVAPAGAVRRDQDERARSLRDEGRERWCRIAR